LGGTKLFLYRMDPHDLLITDHKALRAQAEALKSLVDQDPQKLATALAGFQTAVQKHFKVEDAYFRVLDNDKRIPDRGLVHQLRNDHAAVVFTLESLAIRLRKNGVNPDWRGRFDNLMAVFLPHLDQEEKRLFTLGRKMLSAGELEQITQQIQNYE
jgi:hemerythrin-like domain-containing protein